MPAGPIASPPWAPGSWSDTVWEADTWGLLVPLALDLCDAVAVSLMPRRTSPSLMTARTSYSLMPRRSSDIHCANED